MPVEFKIVANKDFFDKLKRAGEGQLEKEIPIWLDALGIELIDLIQKEVISLQVVDTRKLLQSFAKGSEGNVWRYSDGGLTLEVGTALHYARYVNNGHWLNPKGVSERFVPGEWNGDRFVYIPGAKTGMVLKQKYVDPRPYWDNAMGAFKEIFPQYVNAKFRQWISKYMK